MCSRLTPVYVAIYTQALHSSIRMAVAVAMMDGKDNEDESKAKLWSLLYIFPDQPQLQEKAACMQLMPQYEHMD